MQFPLNVSTPSLEKETGSTETDSLPPSLLLKAWARARGQPLTHPRDQGKDWWKDQQVQGSPCVARSQVKDLLTVDWKILIYRGEVTDL